MLLLTRPKFENRPQVGRRIFFFFFFFYVHDLSTEVDFYAHLIDFMLWNYIGENYCAECSLISAYKGVMAQCNLKANWLKTIVGQTYLRPDIWHLKKKKKKNATLFFRILRSVGRGQHNNVFFFGLISGFNDGAAWGGGPNGSWHLSSTEPWPYIYRYMYISK